MRALIVAVALLLAGCESVAVRPTLTFVAPPDALVAAPVETGTITITLHCYGNGCGDDANP